MTQSYRGGADDRQDGHSASLIANHRFLSEKVGEGVFATQSAAVANAIEQMMQDEEEREVALSRSR